MVDEAAAVEAEVAEEEEEEETKDEFAYTRSHEASKFAYETSKVIAQTVLLINGGAATAVIALLSRDRVDQALLTWVPWGVGAYAAGVLFAAVMLFCVMMMADNWNYFWYWSSHGEDPEYALKTEARAHVWHKGVYIFFAVSIICFIVGSGFVAYGLAKSKPTTPTSAFPSVIYVPAPPK